MKKWYASIGVLLIVLVGVLTACGLGNKSTSKASSGYQNSIAKGLDAVAQDKMDKAVSYFQNALDQKAKDKKATAYLKQAQGYLDVKQQLNDGDPVKAEDTVVSSLKVKNGAKSLTTKLTTLKKEVKADVKDYDKIKAKLDDANKQYSAKQYDKAKADLDAIKGTDWAKKPYLKKLKAKFDQLNKSISDMQINASSSSTASSSSDVAASDAGGRNSNTQSNHVKADQIRKSLVASFGGAIGLSQLQKLDDSVILAADAQSTGNTEQTGKILLQQHPEINPSQDDGDDASTSGESQSEKDACNQLRDTMVHSFGYSAEDVEQIPDSTIIANNVGNATNAKLAETVENIRKAAGLARPEENY